MTAADLITAVPAPVGTYYATTFLFRGNDCAPALILTDGESAVRVLWLGRETNSYAARSTAMARAEKLGIDYDDDADFDLPDWEDCPDDLSPVAPAHRTIAAIHYRAAGMPA